EDFAMSVATLVREGALALSIAAFSCAGSAMAAQTPPPAGAMPVGRPRRVQSVQLKDLAAYGAPAATAVHVPGMAAAVVTVGRAVLEEGYGVRNVESDQPVDAHTIFAIASNTKALTAASLSMLADAGKLDMGGRVIEYLPWFRMSDPYVTHAMRVRDLLAHHSGLSLGAGDLLYW